LPACSVFWNLCNRRAQRADTVEISTLGVIVKTPTPDKSLIIANAFMAGGLHSICFMLDNVGAGIEQFMNLVSARQKLVASNIANADTPGYQTKDVDFENELQTQMSGSKPNVIEVSGLKNKNDGNNVDMDREARLLAENALRFSVASQLAHSEISTIRTAIQEGGKTS
jgi:flagellar basal-body rod protein FlgB